MRTQRPFGLNPKSKDDAKKLKAAQKVIADFLADFNGLWDREDRMLTSARRCQTGRTFASSDTNGARIAGSRHPA
jgi:hypothetical protein